ncbi:MAG: endolytic transglycosylase MltG [Porphyromonadaceae bacterium]|nr:endolytic transglycosylase MltG [Porphyromonadaceae bacterium]
MGRKISVATYQRLNGSSYGRGYHGGKRSRWWLWVILLVVLALVGAGFWVYRLYQAPVGRHTQTVYLLIDRDDTPEDVRRQIHKKIWPTRPNVFDFFWSWRKVDEHLRTGRYAVPPEVTTDEFMSILISGNQAPVDVPLLGIRTEAELIGQLDKHLMLDSAELVGFFQDSVALARQGVDREQARSLFLARHYTLEWDISLPALVDTILHQHQTFWTAERKALADSLGLSQSDVSALAAILEEESSKPDEYSRIAGLYINRLRKGMPLQSDPTIKFALGDFSLRRILYEHLEVASPYNTYRNVGLTPGPIRLVRPSSLDAVLQAEQHNYLYMVAKDDFSGYHNFAADYATHLRNARLYQQELNRRGIKK